MINTLANIALFVLLGGSFAFVVPYALTVDSWWREEHRAHVVAFSSVVLAFALLYVGRALSGNAPAVDPHSVFQWVRLILLWLLAAAVVWRAVIFWRGVLRRRRHRRRSS